MNSSKLYVTCPACGKRLCRAVPGSELEQDCPKCRSLVLVQVDPDGKVSTKIIDTKTAS